MTIYNPYENIDPRFDMSKIKIIYAPLDGGAYLPRAKQVFKSLQANLPPEEVAARDEEWAKANAKEPLQNEQMVSVRFVDTANGDLKVAPAEYRDWKTMAKKGFYKSFGDMYIPNSLNVQMLVQTADNYLVLGDRPPKENGKQPAFQIPGGMLDTTDKRDGVLAPDVAARRELKEELNYDLSLLSEYFNTTKGNAHCKVKQIVKNMEYLITGNNRAKVSPYTKIINKYGNIRTTIATQMLENKDKEFIRICMKHKFKMKEVAKEYNLSLGGVHARLTKVLDSLEDIIVNKTTEIDPKKHK